MRLRGMSTELDETGVPASKLRESIKNITASAGQMVDIMKDDNTFKSTTEILKELSEVYPKLTDAQKAWMQKNIAGVHQGNVYASIMKNMQEGIDATSTALNSNGSALKENAIYMDSASAKINEFKESLKEVWINTIDSSTIKGVVESGTAILNVFNKMTTTFGAFPTVISTVVAGLSLFNSKARESMGMFTNALPVVGKFSIKLQTLGEQYKKSASDIQTQITKLKVQQASMNATGGSVDGFNSKLSTLSKQLLMTNVKLAATKLATMTLQSVLSFGLSFAISGAINLFTKLGDSVLHPEKRIEELQEAMDNFNSSNESNKTFEEDLSSYEKVTSELNNANLTLDERKSKLEEIESLKSSLSSYDSQISGILNNQNLTYDEQIAKLKMISEAKQKQNAEDLEETLKGGFFDTDQGVKAEQQLESLDKYIARLKEYQDLANNNNVGDTVKTQAWGKMELGSDEWDEKVKDTQTKIKELYLSIDEYNQAVASMGDYTDRKQVAVSDEVRNYVLSLMKVSDETAKAVGGVDGLTDSYGNQTPEVKDATTALQEYANSINGADWSKDLSPTEIYGKAISEVETLQGYINDMNSETGYTAQLVSEIAQKYPEIGARVTDAEQVQQFLNDKIAEQVGIQNQAYEIMIGNDNDYYSAKIKNNQDYQNALNGFLGLFTDNQGKAYSIDLSLYNNLNEAKSVALNKFGQGVDNFLKQFVYGNDQAYRIDVANFNNLAQAKAQTISSLSGMLAKLQNQTAIAFTEQANAMNEMKALANGSWINGTGKNGTNQMNVFEGAKEQKREIKALQNKISQLEQISSSGLSPGGYTGTSFNGTSFSPTTSGFGGGSGSKGGSGSSSAKEGTYLQDLYDRYSELQKAIDRCSNAYDLLEEKKKNASDKDKLKYIKEQIDLINKQKDAVNALRNEQQKQYNELKGYLQGKGFNINSDGAITNYSRIKELTAWAGTNDERKEEVEAINDAIEEFNDLVQNDMPKSRKEFESLTNTVAELNEEMKDIYKSELELVTDAQEEVVDIIKDRLDKQKELLDKEYEDRKEALEKTKKLYQDQNAEEDYAEELAEEQKKLDEMKNSLIDLQRDVSGNSDALIADMKKQIEEQEKVIRDKQKQYERDKTEQALDQAIEDIENEKQAMDKQWEEQYSEANIVQMATQALNTGLINLNGEVVSLQDAMIQFENESGRGLMATGNLIKSEMIDNFTTARDLLKEIEYINANLGVHSYVNASNGTGTSAYNNVDFSAQLVAAQTSTATKAIGNSGIGAVYGNNATIDNSVVIKDNNFGYNVEEILTKVLDKNQKEMQAYILELFNNQ